MLSSGDPPQIEPPEMFRDILKHGVMLERTAETITDGLRSLILEREGYSTKVFEFVSTEHTPKNNMLVGTRHQRSKKSGALSPADRRGQNLFGIREHHLESLLIRRRTNHTCPQIYPDKSFFSDQCLSVIICG